MKHIWNILSYMLFYCLLGAIVGVGIGNLIILAVLGGLSYGINYRLLHRLYFSMRGIDSIKKRFFVFEWQRFYLNLLITVALTVLISASVYWLFYRDGVIDWRYIGACWVLVFLNTHNIYEVRFRKAVSNIELLQQIRDNRISGRVHFVKESEEFLVCYATYAGIKSILRWLNKPR